MRLLSVERVCFTVRFFVSTQSRKAAKKMRIDVAPLREALASERELTLRAGSCDSATGVACGVPYILVAPQYALPLASCASAGAAKDTGTWG